MAGFSDEAQAPQGAEPPPPKPGEAHAASGAAKGNRKAFLLRLPPELHDELRAWAGQEFRSLNAHIEYLLRVALKRRRTSKD